MNFKVFHIASFSQVTFDYHFLEGLIRPLKAQPSLSITLVLCKASSHGALHWAPLGLKKAPLKPSIFIRGAPLNILRLCHA